MVPGELARLMYRMRTSLVSYRPASSPKLCSGAPCFALDSQESKILTTRRVLGVVNSP